MTRVLLLEGGGALGCAVQSCLRRSVSPYWIVSVDIDSELAGVYRGNINYLLPKSWKAYEKKVREIIAKEKIEIIIPCHDITLTHLSKVDYGIPTIIDKKMVSIARDKYATVEWLKKNNLPYPETWKKISEITHYPVIIKPRKGWASRGTYIAYNKKEAETYQWLCIKEGWSPIIQELLSGPEYTNMALIGKKGNILATTVSEVMKRNGTSVKITTYEESTMNQQVGRVARKLGIVGPVNMQAIRTPRGFVIFEFNARFSMTQPIRAEAGVNGPDILITNWLTGSLEYKMVKKTTKAFLTRNYLYLSEDRWKELKKKKRYLRNGELEEWL